MLSYDATMSGAGGAFLFMVMLSLAASAPAPALAQDAPAAREDATALIQRVIDYQERQQELTRQYAFHESIVTRDVASDGRVNDSESETFLVTPAPGGEYRRLIAKNGAPLVASDEAEEEKKFQKFLADQLRMAPEERDAETEKKLQERTKRYRERLTEALEVFDFEERPDETVAGQPVRVFRFSPKPSFEGHSRATKILAHLDGTVWIDDRRDQIARLELRFREGLKFLGGVFGRVSEGSHASAVADCHEDLWLLDRIDVSLDARLYFLKKYRQQITFDYHDYQKYTVATKERVTPVVR
jgi:hypothetical protein